MKDKFTNLYDNNKRNAKLKTNNYLMRSKGHTNIRQTNHHANFERIRKKFQRYHKIHGVKFLRFQDQLFLPDFLYEFSSI